MLTELKIEAKRKTRNELTGSTFVKKTPEIT